MDLTRLRHIVAVHRNRSFSRAAEEAGISQPALSRSISAFERRHGVILFDRGRGGVHPTAAGLHVIEQAHKLLAAATDLERSLQHYPDAGAGRIAFGLGPLIAGLFLARLSSALLTTWPALQVVALTRPPDQLVADLLNDRIEMIIGNNWNLGRTPGTELERLGRLTIAPMVRAGHPLAGRERITLADLENFPVASAVELPNGSGGTGMVISDNFHVLRDTVLRTDCSWMSSPAFLEQDIRIGRVVQLNVADFATESEICLVFKRNRTRSPVSRRIAEEIRAMAEELSEGTTARADD